MTDDTWKTPIIEYPEATGEPEPEAPKTGPEVGSPEWIKNFHLNRRMKAANIPAMYAEKKVSSFIAQNAAQNALRGAVADFLSEFDTIPAFEAPRGLMVFGAKGSGKTHLMVAALRELIRRGHTGLFLKPYDLFTRIKSTFGRSHFDEDVECEADIIDELVTVDVLLIDDLGSGRSGAEWEAEKIYQIIDGRMERGKTCLITSNWDLEQLAGIVGERVVSRLYEICRIYNTVGWEDWRIRKQEGK